MLHLLSGTDLHVYKPRYYTIASTDKMSAKKVHDFEQNVSIHLRTEKIHSLNLVLGGCTRLVHQSKSPCGSELFEFDLDDALGFLHRYSIGLSHPTETRKYVSGLPCLTNAVRT